MRAEVRQEFVGVYERFWNFVETQARRGKGDGELEALVRGVGRARRRDL